MPPVKGNGEKREQVKYDVVAIKGPDEFVSSQPVKFEKRKRRAQQVRRKIVQDFENITKLAKAGECPHVPYGNKKWVSGRNEKKKFEVPQEKLFKYSRGEKLKAENPVSKLLQKEKEIEFSLEQAARTEILLCEKPGFLQTDEGEVSTQFTQKDIVKNVDITSATKHFELSLPDFGPYRINYTRNGRHLLIGGRKGHIAAFDWVKKRLACEINVMEEVFDVHWFHNELMFAVAQKKWLYVYDRNGVELHCVRNLYNVLRMEFLPYHFLLTASSSNGFLSWLDVTMGKLVAHYQTHKGCLNIMTQNPYNAVTCLGHPNGTVTMWSPNVKKPLAKMLCHKKPLSSIAINVNGMYMATAAVDSNVKIWDLRNLTGPLQDYWLPTVVSNMSFSDNSSLAISMGNIIEVYNNCCKTTATRPYLRYRTHCPVSDLQFCPYEDVLGIGTGSGFSSILVPGTGEPNFDALESNPYQTKKQRQEAEIKSLLQKIQPELITLDPYVICDIDVPTLQEKLEAKKKLALNELPKIDFKPRRKSRMKGKMTADKTKKVVKEQIKRQYIKMYRDIKDKEVTKEPKAQDGKPYSVLDRFERKKKK